MRRSSLGIRVVDLFSGAGGFSRGFREAGFDILLGVDINHDAVRTFSVNFPEAIALEEDVRNVTGREVIELVGKPDIVIGSPPCEAFTAANPFRMRDPLDRLYLDERGNLTLEFVRLVGELRPKVFVMENVPALAETRELKEALAYEFRRAGYERIYFNFLDAEDYGNPSRRRRLFVSNVPLNPRKVERKVTVWEAIADLQGRTDVPNNEIYEPNEKKLRRIAKMNPWDYLTMYRAYNDRNIPLYVRLPPDEVAPTVLGNSRFIHPFEDRFLTVREQARLMSYPDDHIFLGSRDEQYNQVGEAVPVALSRAIAEYVKVVWNDLGPS
ncbi:MAG: DNA cytosine methyltransferase [Thermoprotei archaeon]